MRYLHLISIVSISSLLLIACSSNTEISPEDTVVKAPVAEKRAKRMLLHGDERIDNYHWIRDDTRTDPDMLAYLKAENSYTEKAMAQTEELQESLFNEITARLKADDSTVPVRRGNYVYHREYQTGGEHPVYLRRPYSENDALAIASEKVEPEVILDINVLSKGHEYFKVSNWVISSNDKIIAYAEDNVSRRIYKIRFKNLETDEYLTDVIENSSSSIAWANDNKHFFYVSKDPVTLLPNKVMRHTLGQAQSEDVLVYEEVDQQFYTDLYKSRSKAFIVIQIESTDSSEIRLIDANQPTTKMETLLARQADLEYRIRHVGNKFYIVTNWQATNFRLMTVADDQLGKLENWQAFYTPDADTLLEDIEVFDGYVVLDERFDGLTRLKVIDLETAEEQLVEFLDPTYTAGIHANPEVSATGVRYSYASMTQPKSIFEYDFATRQSTLLKQDEILGGFDSSNYKSERIKITARDGTKVPVSIVYRKDKFKPSTNPLFIYAYGSYGSSSEAYFSPLRLSLLDRGFVYAIAHVRGGEEMGRHWYEDGKLFNKRNTFWDFIDVTDGLVKQGYGDKDKVVANGGSAGGLLMGVVANEAPEKYLAIIAAVPFVDVVTTMLDESIPLTVGEYTEWGNPNEKAAYDYMMSYSPYDQIKKQDYPHIFVTTGLHDSQVQYFEPVKWVAKLRDYKTDDNKLLIEIDMTAGHGGSSGRYEQYRTSALEYAFILDLLK